MDRIYTNKSGVRETRLTPLRQLKKLGNRLKAIPDGLLQWAFCGCSNLTSVSFPSLTSIGNSGMYMAFSGCTGLTTVSFRALRNIGSYGMIQAFQGCTGLTGSVSFPVLTSIGEYGMNYAFQSCTNLTAIHFLTSMSANSTFVTRVNQCGKSSAIVWDL